MTLASVVAGQQISHNDIDQIINLLTGAMNDQTVTLKVDNSHPYGLILDTLNASQQVQLNFRDAGVDKWAVYKPPTNNFYIWDYTRAAVTFAIAPNGSMTLMPTAGDVVVGGTGRLVMAPAAAKILAGATSISLRDSGDTLDLLLLDSTGLATHRNAIKVPPSVGGTIAATNYGSIPVKIDEKDTTGAAAASITFSSIPSGFRHLKVYYRTRSTGTGTGGDGLNCQLNGDTGATQYDWTQNAGLDNGTTSITGTRGTNAARVGVIIQGGNANANLWGHGEFTIVDYNSGAEKAIFWQAHQKTGTAAGNIASFTGIGSWRSTAAVTSIGLSANDASNIKIYAELWGIP